MLRAACVFLTLALLASKLAAAAELSGYVVGTSDYVYRGVTQSDGHAALQAGVDLAFESGLFLGTWASTVDIPGPLDHQRRAELRAYLGYGFDISEQLHLTLSTVAYRYPDASGPVDYDNHETSISLGIADTYWIEYAYSPNLYGTSWDTHNVELLAEWPVGTSYSVGAGVGRYHVENLANEDTYYWRIGATRFFSRFDLDLRYHHADETIRFVSTPDRIGSRVSLSLRFGF